MKKILKFLLGILLVGSVIFGICVATLPLPGSPTILMYHFLGSPKDARESKNFVSAKEFRAQMDFLKRFGYRVISLEELYAIKSGEKKSRGREVVITFDDGNYTFEGLGYPILKHFRFPVSVFVVSESVKRQLHGSMSIDTLRELLHAGWLSLGTHTKTHPFLTEMNEEQVREELIGSKKDLENLFGKDIHYLAYPYGEFDERVSAIAEDAGFQMAFTTSPKKLKNHPEGLFSITRTKVTRSCDNPFVFWFKVSGLYNQFKGLRHRFLGRS